MNIVIAGLGKYFQEIEQNLQADCHVVYYLDNSEEKQQTLVNGRKVCSFFRIDPTDIDYFLITNILYESVKEQLLNSGIKEEKIIAYFDEEVDFYAYADVFQVEKTVIHNMQSRIVLLNKQIKQMKEDKEIILDHFVYEVADKMRKNEILLPKIASLEETYHKIADEHMSVSRFGDGEFQIILGKAQYKFQNDDAALADRLREILLSNLDHHIVALADDYGSVDIYGEKTRNDIRRYMTESKRKQQYQFIDMDKQYYNAYISRPYVYYPRELYKEAKERFEQLKKIWAGQDVVIVEGDRTRMGVGNDLFSGVNSLARVIAPNENAFSVYDRILQEILDKVDTEKQILIALGPTATVLAYDLAKQGYWAIDIGHIDLEYEWFLRGKGKCQIPYKYNNEMTGGAIVADIEDEAYANSILTIIK